MPNHWLFLPIRKGNARIASFYGLMESTSEAAPLSAPMTLDAWVSAAHGDTSGLWFESLLAQLAFPESFVWGDVAAVARADTPAAKRYFSSGEHRGDSIIGNPATDFALRRRRPGARMAGQPDRERVRPCPDVEGGDAPGRRHARLRDPGPGRDEASSSPTCPTATRSCWPSSVTRPTFWSRAAESEHAAAERLPRHRQGRRLAVHARKQSTSRPT